MGLGIRDIRPIVASPLKRVGERRRHLGAEIETIVGPAGLEEKNAHVGVFGEPRGQDVPGRARPDDDEVVFPRHVGVP